MLPGGAPLYLVCMTLVPHSLFVSLLGLSCSSGLPLLVFVRRSSGLPLLFFVRRSSGLPLLFFCSALERLAASFFLSAGGPFSSFLYLVGMTLVPRSCFVASFFGARAARRFSSRMGPGGLPPSALFRMRAFSCACDSLSCASDRVALAKIVSERHAAFCASYNQLDVSPCERFRFLAHVIP